MFDLIMEVIGAIEHEVDEILNWLAVLWMIFTSAFFLYVLITNPFWRSDSKNYIIADQAELSRLFQIARDAGNFDEKRVRAAYDDYQQATVKYLGDLESLSFWDWRREEAVCDEYKAHLVFKIDSLRSVLRVKDRVFNIKY
ncbi:uncharacterized protein PpBr36_10079 [Pyricularia pennisetigena]|uniref:uncharacterized protein n=1 Tax=Pyricularia pennisetigena TaxID=1578925 RepID=UPI00115136B0|nr:uncharacterized protein PpBr36_10079 [Pyricularia pennisetigena]TLS22258.1 hypothetical protein PpBr36_10079 [Pyricularia pennisetigena]